jgi:hypothetical protein
MSQKKPAVFITVEANRQRRISSRSNENPCCLKNARANNAPRMRRRVTPLKELTKGQIDDDGSNCTTSTVQKIEDKNLKLDDADKNQRQSLLLKPRSRYRIHLLRL